MLLHDARREPTGLKPGTARPDLGDARRFQVTWAADEADLRLAQRLRYQVFAEEFGARLAPPPGTPAKHDADLFDPYCDHLLVQAVLDDGTPGEVVGTYRVLTPTQSRRIGGLYTDTEFDLTRLRPLRPRMVELGRSCVHPAWRQGGVIMALWAALGEFMARHDLDTMVGCASIGMRDGGHTAASLWRRLSQTHLAPIELQVTPRLALPVDDLDRSLDVIMPPLIKGYLRCGAKVLGPPAWDPDFNSADLPLLLRLSDLPTRHRRHFLHQ